MIKRVIAVIAASLWGFTVSWFCLYTGSKIDWIAGHTISTTCYEIDHCSNVPWFIPALLIAAIFAPAVIYGGVGYCAMKKGWARKRYMAVFSVLSVLTVVVYYAGYALF